MPRPEFLNDLGVKPTTSVEPAVERATHPVSPDIDLAALCAMADRTGKRMQFYFAHHQEWPEDLQATREAAVSANVDELHAALTAAGLSLEAVGWTVSATGLWHRVGEDPPPDPDAITAETILALAREKGWPGLFAHGRYVGSGEDIWVQFVNRAHPMWFPVAAAALLEYVNRALTEGALSTNTED